MAVQTGPYDTQDTDDEQDGEGHAPSVHGDVELTHLRQFGLTHLFQVARSWRVPSSLVNAHRGLCHLA